MSLNFRNKIAICIIVQFVFRSILSENLTPSFFVFKFDSIKGVFT